MKRILVSLLTPVLVIGVVGSGVLAWFSDTETSTDNTFTTGTLDLGLSNTDEMATGSTKQTFTAEKWAPGQTEDGTLYISNSGSIDMKTLEMVLTYDLSTTNRPTNIDLNDPLLDSDAFDKMITVSKATWTPDGGSSTNLNIVGQTLAALKNTTITIDSTGLAAGKKGALYMQFTFSKEATNGCQGNVLDLTLTATGKQDGK